MAEGHTPAGDRPRRGGVIFDVDSTLLDKIEGSAIGALSGSRREPSPDQPGGGPAARR